MDVRPFSSTTTLPLRPRSSPGIRETRSGFGLVPIAWTTISTSRVNSLPSINSGDRRPLASMPQRDIRTHSIPVTQHCSPKTRVGFVQVKNSIPSSFACSISALRAGISSSPLR